MTAVIILTIILVAIKVLLVIRREKQISSIKAEQRKQAKKLARHDKQLVKQAEEIEKLNYRLSAAEANIEHWRSQACRLYALLDIEEAEQASAVPGSDKDIKHQKRIIALNNQINNAESKLSKAKFEKAFCEGKLAS